MVNNLPNLVATLSKLHSVSTSGRYELSKKMNKEFMPIEKLISETGNIRYSNKKCFYAPCQNKPISSHTIPEHYLFKLNSDLKKIRTFQTNFSKIIKKENQKLIKEIDKKKFTTFKGFCAVHDNSLFESIDLFDGKIDKKKASLIHYRNICYGIYHIRIQILRIQHLSRQNYIGDLIEKEEKLAKHLGSGVWEKQLEFCLNEHEDRKKQIEQMIKSDNYEETEFLEMSLDSYNLIFCGRSTPMLSPRADFFKLKILGYHYMPWITYMTLLDHNKKNTLIFCFLENDKKYARFLSSRLNGRNHLNSNDKLLRMLAYACSDGFAVEVSFYEKNRKNIDEIIQEHKFY